MRVSDLSRDELFERWAERCFGAKEHLTSPFSYEPQAAHSCPECGLLFVGTSAGDVFLVDGTAEVEPSPTGRHLTPIGGRFEDGVSSIEGCWRCADHLLIASGNRCVAVPPGDGERRPLAEADGRVTLLRTFPLARGGQVLFVADERRFARVYLLSGAGERLIAKRRLRWSPRWADTEARVSTSRAGTLVRWLVVAADGRMARLRLDVERGALDAEELPPLVEMPRCVGFAEGRAGDRVVLAADEDALREITPGMTHVGQYATLIEQPRIQFVGLRYLFGVPMLTVCAAGGWTGACQWPTARSTHRPTWFLGPALDSDTHGVWVSPHGRDATDAVWTALLSDNRVLRIMLCNPFEVREALCRLTAWEGKTGAERYAQFSVAPWTIDGAKATQYVRDDGDARCLEGALTWLEEASIDRLDADAYIRLSVEILIAAGRLGRETVVRHARRLQKILVHQLRGPRAAQIDALQPWLDFLDRYFANVPFSLERKLRLESFLEGEPPKSLNALLHAARLRRQGFDLLQETPQFDVWALATARDRGGRTWLAAACGDGSIWKARVSTSGELEGRTSVLDAGDPGRFGAYSRVLAFTPGTDGKGLLAAPRHFLKDIDGLTKPRWPPKDPCDSYGYFDKTQIYSMLALGDGFLVGTRSVTRPLALWAPFSTDGGLKYIDSPFGLQRGEHGPTAGAVCRIWAITELCPGWLAVGAQDGHLRVFPWSRGDLDVAPARARSFFLGSSVRILHRFTVGPRALLAAGTEGGHLFVFELDPTRPTEFAIKFREAFRSSVVAIFTDADADGGDATRLFVLNHGGRLSTFDLTPGRSFLGRRNRHHDVWHTASIATWLGKDDEGRALIAVGGWDRAARRGVLRLIRVLDYDRSFLRTPTRARVVEEAIQASSRFTPERAEALLAGIPVGDASLRATLAEYAARECQFSGVDRIADALRANPDDNEEVKTLLDADRAALDACPPAEAPLRLNLFVTQLISETGKLKLGLSTSRRLRATTLRRLISANALRFWRRAQLDPNLLPRFVHRHLQDPEPDVRQEVMRSLAEALYGLVRAANADPSANLPQEAFPGKRGWGWVVEVIAPHLHPHQAYGSAYDCELDPLAWGATSVLVNLFRLFPNATLAILDDVCRHRVPGPIISLVGRRLQNRKDAAIVAKMNYYLPWESVEPSRHDLLARCRGGARESLPVVKGSPDDVYLTESSLTHRIFRGMLQVNKEDELRNLHDTMGAHCRKLLERGAKDEVSVWLRRAVTRLIMSAEGADRERVVSSQDDELWSSAARLPSPERELAVGSLTHWRRLSVPDLPGQGVQIGNYKLGASFQRSPTVFEVDGRDDCLIAVFVHKSRQNARRMANAWRKIHRLSADEGTKLVHVIDVVDDSPFPAIVMERLPGQNLARAWNELVSQPAESRFALALTLYRDVKCQLAVLHGAQLCHGDVKPRNVVVVHTEGGHRFYLVDFDSVCSNEPAPAGAASGADSELGPLTSRGRALADLQREDSAHLLDIAVHLLAKQSDARSLDPAKKLNVEPVGDRALWEDAQGLIREWRRARRIPCITFVCAPRDEAHLESLRNHLKAYAQKKGLAMWCEHDVAPGQDLELETRQRLMESQFVVLMVSADLYWRSDQLQLLEEACAREDGPVVIPVMVRRVDVSGEWFGRLKMLPGNGDGTVSVQDYDNEDNAWHDVATGIRRAVAVELGEAAAEPPRRRPASVIPRPLR